MADLADLYDIRDRQMNRNNKNGAGISGRGYSLVSLLAAQRHQRNPYEKPNTLASVGEGMMLGIANGMEDNATQRTAAANQEMESRKAQLDYTLKFLDIRDKMQKTDLLRENASRLKNIAIRLGVSPPDPETQMQAQSMANDSLPAAKSTLPQAVSNVGKMNNMLDSFKATHDMSWTENQNGGSLTIRNKPKDKESAASMAQRANIVMHRETLARKIYNSDHPQKQKDDGLGHVIPYNPTTYELQQSGAYGAADAALSGRIKDYEKYIEESNSPDFILKDENFNDMFGGQ